MISVPRRRRWWRRPFDGQGRNPPFGGGPIVVVKTVSDASATPTETIGLTVVAPIADASSTPTEAIGLTLGLPVSDASAAATEALALDLTSTVSDASATPTETIGLTVVPAFSPLDLGPEFFVEGDLGVTYPGGIPPNVLAWADQSGNAHNVSVLHPTPFQAVEPTYNGEQGIEFPAGIATLQTTSGWLTAATSWTFIVTNADGVTPTRTAMDGSGASRFALIFGSAITKTLTAFSDVLHKITKGGVDPTIPHAVFIAWNGAGSSMIVDGGAPTLGDLTLAAAPGGLLIGGSALGAATDTLHGPVMALAQGYGTKTPADIANLFAWSHTKYNVP